MSNDKLAERQRFEEWYTTHAHNYSINPIGSRDCALQWDAWEAALQAHAAEAARAHSVPGELAEPIEGAFNYEQKLAFTEGWNACRDAMLAAAPQQAAEPVRQFRVVPKGSVWTDVKDPEIWASVIAHPESYETRVLYTHPQPAQERPCTCHPDDNPPVPCPQRFAFSECVKAAQDAKDAARYRWLLENSRMFSSPECDGLQLPITFCSLNDFDLTQAIDDAMAKESGNG